ncbi:MAG: reactive intermediate/imine deaminase [Pseudonocardiales bacterium]|nr:MAG: reactive intermediate/imine deaminase [Pseudonocardiales bacterium]
MAKRQNGRTDLAPAPAGPYSQAVRMGPIAVSAGHGGATADGVLAEDICGQVRQALDNVLASLQAVGAGSDDVAQVRVYLTDTADFAAMNDVYRTYFSEPFPVRTTVYVTLPAGMLVEIDAHAVLPENSQSA